MTWPLDLSAWVDRIRAANVDGLKTVGLAGDLQRIKSLQGALPGAWVLPSEESTRATAVSPVPKGRRQITSRVTVVLALRNYGDSSGGKASDLLRPFRAGIAGALQGWKIETQSTPVVFVGGQASELDDAVMWWQDFYEVTHYE